MTQNVEVEGASSQEETENRGRQTFSHLLGLSHPNDPAHVLQLKIKYDEAFIQFCNNFFGPYQPLLSSFPNNDGGSHLKKWYVNNEEKQNKSQNLERIKEHTASESHMYSMVRWNNFKKISLEAGF